MGSRAWSSTSAGLSSVNRHSNFGAVSKAVSTGHPAPAEIRNHLGVASSNPLFFWILCSYFIPQNWPKKIQKDTQSMKSMKSVWTEKTLQHKRRGITISEEFQFWNLPYGPYGSLNAWIRKFCHHPAHFVAEGWIPSLLSRGIATSETWMKSPWAVWILISLTHFFDSLEISGKLHIIPNIIYIYTLFDNISHYKPV